MEGYLFGFLEFVVVVIEIDFSILWWNKIGIWKYDKCYVI